LILGKKKDVTLFLLLYGKFIISTTVVRKLAEYSLRLLVFKGVIVKESNAFGFMSNKPR